ncbi:MAG: YraN family protein [Ruminococcaceae bacterium]|nr:YraN family protein [Oscillospiraceae bacterium]
MQKIGQLGEKAACRYLKKQGYKILTKNYQRAVGKIIGELDIVAQKGDTVAFVEVKTRNSEAFGLPCEFVTKNKQQKIIKTAYTYISEFSLQANYSFDVIEVLHSGASIQEVRHIPNAFMP